MNYVAIADQVIEELRHKKGETWVQRYPDLNPDEWQVTTLEDGSIHGRKVKGNRSGMIAFIMPADFRPEPTPEPLNEEWNYRKVETAGGTWLVGQRITPGQPRKETTRRLSTSKGGKS